jgi:ATP phosphoribosyltransferase
VDNLEVWFQRASDVMRKMRAGDLDLGIVGYDMFVELGQVRSRRLTRLRGLPRR